MNEDLNCKQVSALLSFYIEGNVNYQIRNFIENHLEKCPKCKDKYESLKKILNDFSLIKKEIDNVNPPKIMPISSYSNNFKEKLSAYVDNELPDEEGVRFKRYAIANPPVRIELEGIYKIKNALNDSFEQTKNNFNDDLAHDIIVQLDMQDVLYKAEPIMKIITIFIFLFVFLSVSAIVLM